MLYFCNTQIVPNPNGSSHLGKDYGKWYNEIVVDADLAQHSDVKGCMVIQNIVMRSGKE